MVIGGLIEIQVNLRNPPLTLFGEPVKPPMYYTSHSNVDRVKILTEVGGIYLDLDVIVTRPFDDLRRQVQILVGLDGLLQFTDSLTTGIHVS